MVVHDREYQQRWTEQRAEQEQKRKKRVRRSRRWSVLGVQSLACVAVLLLAFVLKMAGGGAYEELKRSFHSALAENQLMAVLSGLFEEEGAGVKRTNFTDEEPPENRGIAQPQTTMVAVWSGYA